MKKISSLLLPPHRGDRGGGEGKGIMFLAGRGVRIKASLSQKSYPLPSQE
jgi:hypothetical protein